MSDEQEISYQPSAVSKCPSMKRSHRVYHPIQMRLVTRQSSLVAIFLLFAPALAGGQAHFSYLNTLPDVRYVGSKVCARCHAPIYEEYEKTAMGRSMILPSDPSAVSRPGSPVTVQAPKFNRYYQIFRNGSGLYQSVYALASGGKEIFRDTQKIVYLVGAGENGIGYIAQTGEYLFEAPLSYYARSGSWELSPGYESGDYGFHRAVAPGCIICHSGRANPAPGPPGRYRTPAFTELAIGCENCHGPGALHVSERMKGAPFEGPVDRSIVNPARLPGWLADNVCMICHQFGDIRVLQPGRNYLDFRPGTPLDETVAIFATPFTAAFPPESPLLQHYTLMTLSRCYLGSGGKLSCITCHDPHQEPSAAKAAAYYREKCLQCHREKSCTMPVATRLRKTPPDDCAGCHMPRQNLQGIAHSALTDHRIAAYRGEPFPNAAFHQTTPALPDLVHVDVIPGKQNDPIRPVVLFQAYGELIGAHPQYLPEYEKSLKKAAILEPHNPLILSSEARRDLLAGTPAAYAKATALMGQAIAGGSYLPRDYSLYATLLERSGKSGAAIGVLKRGITVNPYSTALYERLAVIYSGLHERQQALRTLKEELKIFPEDSPVRTLLQELQR
jgi:hypothetical protein